MRSNYRPNGTPNIRSTKLQSKHEFITATASVSFLDKAYSSTDSVASKALRRWKVIGNGAD